MRTLPEPHARRKRKKARFVNPHEMHWEVMKTIGSFCSEPEIQKGWQVRLRRKRIEQAKEAREEAKAERDYQSVQFWDRAIEELKKGSPAPIWVRFDYWVESTDEIDTGPEFDNCIVRVNGAPHIPDFMHRFHERRMHPFRNFYIVDGVAHEVIRSHWKGTFKDGRISVQGGKATPRLAALFVDMSRRWANSLRYMMFDDELREDMASEIALALHVSMTKFDPTHGAAPYSYYMACMNSASYHFIKKELRYFDIKRIWHREVLTHHPDHGEDLAPPRQVAAIEGEFADPLWSMGDDANTVRET